MNWFTVALTGIVTGYFVFGIVWVLLSYWIAKTPAEKAAPSTVTMWAMGIAFAVIALSWSGAFKGKLLTPSDDPYYQER